MFVYGSLLEIDVLYKCFAALTLSILFRHPWKLEVRKVNLHGWKWKVTTVGNLNFSSGCLKQSPDNCRCIGLVVGIRLSLFSTTFQYFFLTIFLYKYQYKLNFNINEQGVSQGVSQNKTKKIL